MLKLKTNPLTPSEMFIALREGKFIRNKNWVVENCCMFYDDASESLNIIVFNDQHKRFEETTLSYLFDPYHDGSWFLVENFTVNEYFKNIELIEN